MAGAWADLVEQGANAAVDSSRWLIEHLLQAEATDRAMRSVRHQMHAAKFPLHRDLAGFDFDISPVDRKLVMQLPLAPDGVQRYVWESRFGSILIEVIGEQAFVNGSRVEPAHSD